jgi:hypothetical protein
MVSRTRPLLLYLRMFILKLINPLVSTDQLLLNGVLLNLSSLLRAPLPLL